MRTTDIYWKSPFKVFYRKFVRRYDSAMERMQMSWVLFNFYQFRIKNKNRYVMFGGTIPSFPVLVLVSDQAEQMGTDGTCSKPVFAENNPNYFLKVWYTFLEKQTCRWDNCLYIQIRSKLDFFSQIWNSSAGPGCEKVKAEFKMTWKTKTTAKKDPHHVKW